MTLLHPRLRCLCHRALPLRVTAVLAELARTLPADAVLVTYRCGCGRLNRILAADVTGAVEDARAA